MMSTTQAILCWLLQNTTYFQEILRIHVNSYGCENFQSKTTTFQFSNKIGLTLFRLGKPKIYNLQLSLLSFCILQNQQGLKIHISLILILMNPKFYE